MGQTLTLRTADGKTIDAYRADPGGAPKGAVVVLQEIFGVNGHIRSVADRFAAEGYVAIAPALFDRAQPGVELGYEPADAQQGLKLRGAVAEEETFADIRAAVEAVTGHGKIGIVGYCWGGSLAFASANRVPGLSAAVGYYGGQIVAEFLNDEPRIPVLLHFGEKDDHIPQSDVERIRARHPGVEIHTYPAGHGFNCAARASYDAGSAAVALDRTLAFFARHLA